ncbi:MAG: hypothetical protein HXY20_00620 [Acidobacteria bacterium]|nr:hypothetical protein [Acidobacteriota bacterium]
MELVTLKCPKCGYLQEERPDCVRCGIVFSKYVALFAPDKTGNAAEQEAALASYPVPAEPHAAELSEIRQALRDAMRRLSDVEFERAERNVLRGEIKSLEQKCQGLFEQFRGRLQALEDADPGRHLEKLRDEFREKELVPIVEHSDRRLQDMAARLKDLGAQVTSQAYAAAERLRGLEGKIDGFAALASEMENIRVNQASLKDQVESIARLFQSRSTPPPESPSPDLGAVEAESAAFRSEVQKALQNHSEQAAAEKAELSRLRSQVEALQRSVDGILRAPRAAPPDLRKDFGLIIGSLDEIRKLMLALVEKLQPPTRADVG